jgi:hypothetical protein
LVSRGVYRFFLEGLAAFAASSPNALASVVWFCLLLSASLLATTISAGGLIVAYGSGNNDCKRGTS